MPAETVDVVVVGGGPAGMAAAATCAEAGKRTVLVDAFAAPGGQVYRLPPAGFRELNPSPERRTGDALRQRLRSSGAAVRPASHLWLIEPSFRLHIVGPDGATTLNAAQVVLAAGTTERIYPFPGWTSPGVIGLAAATILLKAEGVLPGERMIVAGVGPLLALVAHHAQRAGATVVGVVDLAGPGDWSRAAWQGRSRPDLLAKGTAWLAHLRARGVRWHHRHAVAKVTPTAQGLDVTLARVDREGRPCGAGPTLAEADALCIGYGLAPAIEATRLCGAAHRFDAHRGGWLPVADAAGRTSVPGLYVAGDGAGLMGAAAAPLSGEAAALALLGDAGVKVPALRQERLRRRLARAERFGRAMATLTRPRPGLVALAGADTVVCRCEDVRRSELAAALAEGARGVDQVKAWTRAGMGPCQGRSCGEAIDALLGVDGPRWTPRAPLRPVPIDALIGDYDYGDIPIPQAAPL